MSVRRLTAPPIAVNPSHRTPPIILADCEPGDVVEVFHARQWQRVRVVGVHERGVVVQPGEDRYVTVTWERLLLVRAIELRPARA